MQPVEFFAWANGKAQPGKLDIFAGKNILGDYCSIRYHLTFVHTKKRLGGDGICEISGSARFWF